MPARVCLLILAGLLAGCASQDSSPHPISLRYHYTETAQARAPDLSGPCVWIADARRRETFAGVIMPRDEVITWLRDGVEANLELAAAPIRDQALTSPYILLTKAYINGIATSISGIVVLRVHDGSKTHVVRGRATRLNWWGSNAEYSNLLSDALDDALFNLPVTLAPAEGCHADS